MKKLLSKRWFWFIAGIFFFPTLGMVFSLIFGPSPKEAMPFNAYFEEKKTEFFFPADYSYSLKSKVDDTSKFVDFVKKMRMDEFKVTDTLYEKKSEDGQHTVSISYTDGFIIYEEFQI